MNSISDLLGTIAAGVSILMALTGFPAQILKNFRRKSCEGLSLLLVSGAFIAYSAWAAYGIAKEDWFLIISQVLGIIVTGLILIQFFFYRPSRRKA